MVFASWGPDYSVGVAELDAQHRNLFDLVKDFDDCIRRGLARESIARDIDALIQYSRYHFSYEEKLMKKYGYTEIAEQVADHCEFVTAVTDFQDRWVAGGLVTAREVSTFMKEWLTGHILGSDMRYAECLRNCGVA